MHSYTETADVDEEEVTMNDVVAYIHQLKLINDDQTRVMAQLNQTNQALMKSDVEHTATIAQFTNTTGDLNKNIADMKLEMSTLQTSAADLKRRLDTQVIFTATLHNQPITVSAGKVLVFDRLETNLGQGYDVSTGVFTSPVDGYFVFEFHTMSQSDRLSEFNLCVNRTVLCTALADDYFDYQSASCGVTALVRKGDQVQVIARQTSYPYHASYTSFSGHLIALL